jgi:ABC-2 type transport system ATP-binding protein
MIEGGRIVFSDTISAFSNYVEPHSVLAHMENPPSEGELMKIPGVSRVELLTERQMRIFFNGDRSITGKIIESSVHNGWELREINLDKSSVDEIFAQLSNHNPSKK